MDRESGACDGASAVAAWLGEEEVERIWKAFRAKALEARPGKVPWTGMDHRPIPLIVGSMSPYSGSMWMLVDHLQVHFLGPRGHPFFKGRTGGKFGSPVPEISW